jgi:hypothetical protein
MALAVLGMAWLALAPRVPVRAVLDTAVRHGVEHVTVHTSPGSVAMYARNGFAHEERLLYAEPG